MSKFLRLVLCAGMISVFAEEVQGLACLSCQSSDVNSRCRYGQRSEKTRQQVCNGPTAKCLVVATVNEYGNAHFQRGCILEDFCTDMNDTDIEFCFSCAFKNCNYKVIELDKEVEGYLNEVREFETSNFELLQNTTKQAKETVSSIAPTSSSNETHTVSGKGSKSNSYQHNSNKAIQDNTTISPNQIIVGNSDEEGVPITGADESYGNSRFELNEEIDKVSETPKINLNGGKSVAEGSKSDDYVEFGTKL